MDSTWSQGAQIREVRLFFLVFFFRFKLRTMTHCSERKWEWSPSHCYMGRCTRKRTFGDMNNDQENGAFCHVVRFYTPPVT